jgi:peptide/nickel transport system permease protein
MRYVAVPSFALIFLTLGYNTRFYRAVFVEESAKDHIRTAHAFGASPTEVMWKHVLKNSMVPIITRIMFSIPLVIISGSLLIESYFGIPGVGKVTFEAITNGDQPVLKAVVGLTAVAFVLIEVTADLLYRAVDPRVA